MDSIPWPPPPSQSSRLAREIHAANLRSFTRNCNASPSGTAPTSLVKKKGPKKIMISILQKKTTSRRMRKPMKSHNHSERSNLVPSSGGNWRKLKSRVSRSRPTTTMNVTRLNPNQIRSRMTMIFAPSLLTLGEAPAILVTKILVAVRSHQRRLLRSMTRVLMIYQKRAKSCRLPYARGHCQIYLRPLHQCSRSPLKILRHQTAIRDPPHSKKHYLPSLRLCP